MGDSLGHRLGDLADLIGADLRGDPDTQIRGVATLQGAEEGDISFFFEPALQG